jgi:hypothetical protein
VITALVELIGIVVGALVCVGVVGLGLTWMSNLDEHIMRSTDELAVHVYVALNVGSYLVVHLGAIGLLHVVLRFATWL